MTQQSSYIGRYAPSPTGPLHFGSLVTAVASYLDAKSHGGQWLLRIEDLDTPRIVDGAADDMMQVLAGYGFEWDGEVLYQSQRQQAYQSALETLKQRQQVYPCNCSRKEVAAIAHAGIDGPVYAGACRESLQGERESLAWRIRTDVEQLIFHDRVHKQVVHHLKRDVGDYVLHRSDGLFAYQLAVVVDDAEQGITHVVRGADLLNSTTRQIYLQYHLGLPTPKYAHTPLALNAKGEKLSKQTHAKPITVKHAKQNLLKAYAFLGLTPNLLTVEDSLDAIWNWGIQHWNIACVPQYDSRLLTPLPKAK